ncbi:MAG: hypothetical protein WBA73_01445 [Devosia sp.]
MKSLDSFSVQLVTDGVPDKNTCFHVEANSPVQAAELVLGATYVTHGKPADMRALVWKLAEDFTPISIPLFLAG